MVRENILEVGSKGNGNLFRSGGIRAIKVVKIGNSILSGSFDGRLMEEGCVTVTIKGLVFFGTLEMEFLIFG